MANVIVAAMAQKEFFALPLPIQRRVRDIFARLENWPAVSGCKPLRGNLQGNFRVRTGDYRVVCKPSPDNRTVIVWKIGYRGDVYD